MKVMEKLPPQSLANLPEDYMLACITIQKQQKLQHCEEEEEMTGCHMDKKSVSYALIEKVVKQMRLKKTHHAPHDLDYAFIEALKYKLIYIVIAPLILMECKRALIKPQYFSCCMPFCIWIKIGQQG
jgi:hypothetical protein